MTSCLVRCVKAFLMVFNSLFLVCGVLLMALAVWLHVDKRLLVHMQLMHLPPQPDLLPDQVAYALLGIGSGMVVLSFMACCGAWAESPCFLCIYALLVITVIILEVVFAILAGIFYNQIQYTMKDQILYAYNSTATPDANFSNPVTVLWDRLQVTLECCGASGPQDYQMSTWFNLTRHSDGLFVPYSCCVMLDNTVPRPVPVKAHKCQHEALLYRPDHHLDWDFLHVRGCYSAFRESLIAQLGNITGISICILLIEVLNATLACLLLSRIRHDEGSYPHMMLTEEEEIMTLQDILSNNHKPLASNDIKAIA